MYIVNNYLNSYRSPISLRIDSVQLNSTIYTLCMLKPLYICISNIIYTIEH